MRRSLGLFFSSVALIATGCTVSSAPDAGTARWWEGRVFYEIFVRSFADSDGDGHGDLNGLRSRLDELNDGDPTTSADLGVEALWLMPVFATSSYHGYDVTDFQTIEPTYGTLADFDALLAAAHQRGLKVILDFVPNHTSSQHPWFQDSLAQGPRRDWYLWRPTDPGWRRSTDAAALWHPSATGYFYGYFTGGMPDLNWRNPEVETAMTDAMTFWLDRGVDGFRFDAVRYLVEAEATEDVADRPETHAVAKRLRQQLTARSKETLLVAEAWAGYTTVAEYFGQGDEYHLAFAFDVADALRASLKGARADELINCLARYEALGVDRSFDAPFLTNHDMVRVMRQLGGDSAAAHLAAATLLALPGTPFIYYGEELGMQGGAGADDREKRTPMRWDATAPTHGFTSRSATWNGLPQELDGVDVASGRADPASLWQRYRTSIALRTSTPALSLGTAVRPPFQASTDGVMTLVRAHGSSRVLFVANFGATPSGPFTVTVTGRPSVLDEEGLVGAPSSDGVTLSVPGLAARGFALLNLGD